jgi:hypothetical protein
LRKLGVVAIAVAGLWILAQALVLLNTPLTILLFGGGSRYSFAVTFGVSLLPPVGAVVLSVVVILRRQRLSERWFDDLPLDLSLDAAPLLRVGSALIGLTLIAQAIPAFLGSLARPFMLASAAEPMFGLGEAFRNTVPAFVIDIAEVILGLLLIARSRWLADRLWFGRPVKQPAEPRDTGLPRCRSCGAPYDPADYQGRHFTPRCSECDAPLNLGDT